MRSPHQVMLLHHTFFALSFIAVLTSSAVGQTKPDPYFTQTEGKSTSTMPRVIIRNIREDRAGNIWFATFGGPIRYDGKNFTNFAEEVGLPKTRIFSHLVDRNGIHWFGSITGGASRYDGKSFTKFTDKEGLGHNDVMWIFEDRDANIWFGTSNGATRYDGKTMTNFTTKDGLVHNSVHAITQDASGRIWFGTQGGICSYDGKSFSNLADQVGRTFTNVRTAVVDRAGNLWFGGQEGAFRYDGKNLTAFTSKEGLLTDFVGSMIIDRAGNVWLGHPGHGPQGGGATRYDGKSFKQFTHKDGLCCKTVYCMYEDTAGNIWFGSIDAGACRYDGKTFTNFSAAEPPIQAKPAEKPTVAKGEVVSELDKAIWHVYQARNGDYWFGSQDRGVYRYDGKTLVNFTTKDGLAHNHIGGILEDKLGNIYFSTSGTISKFDGRTFSTLTVVEGSTTNDWNLKPDDLWFADASDTGAVFRYDGKFLHRLTLPKIKAGEDHKALHPRSLYPNAKYSPYDVFRIFKDSKGHIWFGTALLGACRYDGKSFLWIPETDVRNGSGGTRSIVEDKDGKFWFSNTLHRYDVITKGAAGQSYRKEKGMGPGNDPNWKHYSHFMSSTVDRSGALWLATLGSGVWRSDGEKVTHYPVKNGDKPVSLISIYQDNHGVMWLGTHTEGAYRFNGKTFEKFMGRNGVPSQAPATAQRSTVAEGETVSEMPKDLWYVFQGKNGHHWFASRSEGAFRYDGKTITRFTSKDGLAGVSMGGIQEDKSGNIYFSTDKGISKFDGQSFTTLEPQATGEWKNQPDDLWFPGGQDSGVVYRYDGKSLHRLAFPKTRAGDDATLPRDKFPNAKFSPYDVYTIFKDTQGHLWFGTAVLGACRYDGKSFTWIPEEELRNANFGLRSIIEYKEGKIWFSNTLHRYAVDLPAHASPWYRKEKGIGDLSGHKQDEYSHFMSSTLGDDGAMWMAILGGVVYRYDGKTMTRYPVTENGKHHRIFSIYKDKQGVLWLGTQAHGVYRFNGKSFEKFRP